MDNEKDFGFFFLNSDIIEGQEIFRKTHFLKDLSGENILDYSNIDKYISYFVHHKRLNAKDTRKVLSFLLACKFGFYTTVPIPTISKDLEYISIPIIIHKYISSKDYKLLQYIYNEEKWADYVYMMNKHFETMMPSEAWKLSLDKWDVEFTKFMYSCVLSKIPWDLRKKAATKTFSPNKKFISKIKLMDQDSGKFNYYENKLYMLQCMFKSNNMKTLK